MWGAKKLKYLVEYDLIINPMSKDNYYEFYVSVYMKKKNIKFNE